MRALRYAVATSLALSFAACQKKEAPKKATPVAPVAPAAAPPATPPAPVAAPVVAPAAYKPRYAQRMFEVAERYHLLGKSVAKGNWGYAGQQAVELYETFKSDLPVVLGANGVTPGVDLKSLRGAYTEGSLKALVEVTKKKDKAAFDKAYAEAAAGCNGCHAQVGKGFVVIKANPAAGCFEDIIDVAGGAGK